MKKIIIAVSIILIALLIVLIIIANRKRESQQQTFNGSGTTSANNNYQPFPNRTTSPANNPKIPAQNLTSSPSSSQQPTGIITPSITADSTIEDVVDTLKAKGPYSSSSFDFYYSPTTNKFVLSRKSSQAATQFQAWLRTQGLSDKLIEQLNSYLLVSNGVETNSPQNETFTNQAVAKLSSFQKNALNVLKQKLPYTDSQTNLFSVDYSPTTDTFFVQKQNSPQADAALDTWAQENNVAGLIHNDGIFHETTASPSNAIANAEKEATQPDISATKIMDQQSTKDFHDVITSLLAPFTDQYTPAPSPSSSQSSGSNTSSTFTDVDILSLIKSYGLPAPTADGSKGYTALERNLEQSSASQWATQQLLNAERLYMSKNPTSQGLPKLNQYLTTAWIWWENGITAWPDPYEINCDNNESISRVSYLCQTSNYQIAAYQAATRRNDYIKVFHLFYSDNQVASLAQTVMSNSDKAIRRTWRYNDSSEQTGINAQYKGQIGAASIGNISPNADFFSGQGQYFTTLIGKDPNMVVGLNTYAVSEGDLITQLHRSDGCPYGQAAYCGSAPIISNLIYALYLFDKGNASTGSTTPNSTGAGTYVGVGNQGATAGSSKIIQVVDEIRHTCTSEGVGVVTSRNVNCLDKVTSISSQARALMKASAEQYAHLQCVGFIVGMVANNTGQDISGRGDAINFSKAIPPGYTYIPYKTGPISVDDIIVFNYDTVGHIANVVKVYDNNNIEIAEANHNPGEVDIRDITLDQSNINGWLHKL